MMFTKFFTVAALATTLTAGAFAMEHEGADSRHEEFKDQVSKDLDFAHEFRKNFEGSSGGALTTFLNYVNVSTKIISACNDISTLEKKKECYKTIEKKGLMKAVNKSTIGKGLKVACTPNWLSSTCNGKDTQDMCGVIACNTDNEASVKKCMNLGDGKGDCSKYKL